MNFSGGGGGRFGGYTWIIMINEQREEMYCITNDKVSLRLSLCHIKSCEVRTESNSKT